MKFDNRLLPVGIVITTLGIFGAVGGMAAIMEPRKLAGEAAAVLAKYPKHCSKTGRFWHLPVKAILLSGNNNAPMQVTVDGKCGRTKDGKMKVDLQRMIRPDGKAIHFRFVSGEASPR